MRLIQVYILSLGHHCVWQKINRGPSILNYLENNKFHCLSVAKTEWKKRKNNLFRLSTSASEKGRCYFSFLWTNRSSLSMPIHSYFKNGARHTGRKNLIYSQLLSRTDFRLRETKQRNIRTKLNKANKNCANKSFFNFSERTDMCPMPAQAQIYFVFWQSPRGPLPLYFTYLILFVVN